MSVDEAERLLRERQLPLAWTAFNASEAAGEDPNRCCGGRWTVAMLRGDFEAAWGESDALRARGAIDPHRFWNGESLRNKRVIVRCLHGFGDTVQMLRYAPALKEEASSVVWEVAPRFVELATCFDGVDKVVTWGEGAPEVATEWDVQAEVMELPYIFRTVQGSLPLAEGYCKVPHDEVAGVRDRMRARRPCVGLVWAGGEWNPARSLPFTALRPLLDERGIAFWNLQGGASRKAGVGLPDATNVFGDGVLALAATIAKLDLVITVDTLAAHLAGAMGKPVWVMLQKEADWRWLAEGERTAWYPTMRLFRQEHRGDWDGIIKQICIALAKEFA